MHARDHGADEADILAERGRADGPRPIVRRHRRQGAKEEHRQDWAEQGDGGQQSSMHACFQYCSG